MKKWTMPVGYGSLADYKFVCEWNLKLSKHLKRQGLITMYQKELKRIEEAQNGSAKERPMMIGEPLDKAVRIDAQVGETSVKIKGLSIEEVSLGLYYCPECDRFHRYTSMIGKKHIYVME